MEQDKTILRENNAFRMVGDFWSDLADPILGMAYIKHSKAISQCSKNFID